MYAALDVNAIKLQPECAASCCCNAIMEKPYYHGFWLYYRFCKNAIFQNFGNIMFFRRFAFFFFSFSPANVSRPSLDRFAPNFTRTSHLVRDLYWGEIFWISSKTRLQRPKNSKNQSVFRPRRHIFARCDKTVKVFLRIFSAINTRMLHLSENVFVIV